MKKITLSAILLGMVSLSAADIHVGVGSSNTMDKSAVEYKIGYGFGKTYQSGIYFGTSFDFGYSKVDNESVLTYSGDGKLGYTIGNTSVYGIGSALYQTFGNSTTAYGFGYGAGAEYKFNEKFSTAVEYKTYSPKLEAITEYDYTNTNLILKYHF